VVEAPITGPDPEFDEPAYTGKRLRCSRCRCILRSGNKGPYCSPCNLNLPSKRSNVVD